MVADRTSAVTSYVRARARGERPLTHGGHRGRAGDDPELVETLRIEERELEAAD
jgi:hypothetical protein